jgi:hypothetical protein
MLDFIQCFKIAKKISGVLVYDNHFQIYDVVTIDGFIIEQSHYNKIEIIKNFKN